VSSEAAGREKKAASLLVQTRTSAILTRFSFTVVKALSLGFR